MKSILQAVGSFLVGSVFAYPYKEAITADGLIGSHFGIPGLPGAYDYVIVGGGTAGLAMAKRLAENAAYSVAVIEAGGFYETDNGNLSSIPADDVWFSGASPTDYNPLIDWAFVTTPQAGLGGREVHYAQGKTFGGGSARNYMAFHRGTKDSYQMWANQVGDQSYTFNNLLKYFQKSIKFTPPRNDLRARNATPSYDPTAFGFSGGPVQVSFANWAMSLSTWVRLGLHSIGIQDAKDFTSGTLNGAQFVLTTIDPADEARSSSETSFMRQSLLQHDNLYFYKSTMAKQILFDSTKKATGVVVQTGSKTYTLSANKEVIVSAGVFHSPQLLMVSGVGPANTLNGLNIPIVSALSGVGQNMWDHVVFGPSYRVDLITHSILGHDPAYAGQAVQNYNSQPPTGILTNTGGDYLAWEKLPAAQRANFTPSALADLATFPADWPEIEYLFLDAYAGLQQNYIFGAPQDGYNYGSAVSALVAPLSRGNVTINSTDTNDPPIINPNWLTSTTDQQLAVAAYKRDRQIFQSDAMKPVVIGEEIFPGPQVQTDAQILQTIKDSLITVFHGSATNKMGMANDTMAVVDSHCRVYGVTGLRVVDISAFPFLPPGHPQATVYALAEKIADDIKNGQ